MESSPSSAAALASDGAIDSSSHNSLPSRIRHHKHPDGRTVRQGKLLSLMATEWDGVVYLTDIYISAAQFLAVKHLQEKSGAVLPGLPVLLEGCDFEMTFEQLETRFSTVDAVHGLLEATSKPEINSTTLNIIQEEGISGGDVNQTNRERELYHNGNIDNGDDWQHPFGIVGAAYSYQTIPLSIVAAAGYELPLISGSATSTALDGNDLFARTVPTNSGDAFAAILHYKSLGISHVACLFIQDAYGQAYHADFKRYANDAGIRVLSFPYLHEENFGKLALVQLKASQVRHVFAVLFEWQTTLSTAYDLGIIGTPEYSWIVAEQPEWTADDFALNRTTSEDDFMQQVYDNLEDMPIEIKLAHALNGIGQLAVHIEEHPPFIAAMEEFANENSTIRREFMNTHQEPEIWEEVDWTAAEWSYWQAFNYDAALAFGIAACQTPGLFTGPELYETLLNLEYEGVTGNVSFDRTTGTRAAASVSYRIDNLILDLEQSDYQYIRFDSKLSMLVTNQQVHQVNDFVYYGDTTIPPPVLPPLQGFDYNLMPVGVQAFGWFLAACVLTMSVSWMLWIYLQRNSVIVRASQPVFLAQLCVGTFIMVAAIIPMGFQGTEPSARLDAACMSIPWLVFIGFVIALSALLAKAWRLNKLMKAGMQMRRIQVHVMDVMLPFAVLMTTNVVLLLAWTLVAPLKYAKEEDSQNVDMFGRSMESYGTCKSQSDNGVNVLSFQIPIVLVDFSGLVIATYQSYKGRNLPTEFSESSHLAMSMASLLESLLLGAPILFMVKDNPTAFFSVSSLLLSIACLCILLPVFIPKFRNRNVVNLTASLRPRASSNVATLRASQRPGHVHDFRGSSSYSLDGLNVRSEQLEITNMSNSQVSEDVTSSSDDHSATWGRMSIRRKSSNMSAPGNNSNAQSQGMGSVEVPRASRGRNTSTLRSFESIPEDEVWK